MTLMDCNYILELKKTYNIQGVPARLRLFATYSSGCLILRWTLYEDSDP